LVVTVPAEAGAAAGGTATSGMGISNRLRIADFLAQPFALRKRFNKF
jgi:hypothetical protein